MIGLVHVLTLLAEIIRVLTASKSHEVTQGGKFTNVNGTTLLKQNCSKVDFFADGVRFWGNCGRPADFHKMRTYCIKQCNKIN